MEVLGVTVILMLLGRTMIELTSVRCELIDVERLMGNWYQKASESE